MKYFLKESNERITYSAVKDVEKFRNYAAEILGGDGGMSDSDIKNSIQE